MRIIAKYNLNDPLCFFQRHGIFQYREPVTAAALATTAAGSAGITGGHLLGAAGIAAGGQLLGGALASRDTSGGWDRRSTFSERQQQMDQLLFDFLMGAVRNSSGEIVSTNPLLSQMANRPTPQRRVAPMTGRQQNVLSAADALVPQITNMKRPDPTRQAQLARGLVPTDPEFQQRPRYLKGGGPIRPGETAVVGDDGPEEVTALPGGGATVTPNPKTLKNKKVLAKALAESEKAEKKTGKRHLQTGTRPEYMRVGDRWRSRTDAITRQTGFAKTPEDRAFREQYEGSGYQWGVPTQPTQPEYGGQAGDTAALDAYARGPYQQYRQDIADWRTDWAGYVTDNPYMPWATSEFERLYDSDISKVPLRWTPSSATPEISYDYFANQPEKYILEAYYGGLQDWAGQQQFETYNPDITAAFESNPQWKAEDAQGFAQWMNQSAASNPYASPMQIGESGQWELTNSFDMTPEKLNAAISSYYAEGGPGYAAPTLQPGDEGYTAPFDYGALAGQIGDQYDRFNPYLSEYQGGALSGYGLNFNPTTGQQEFGTYYGGEWTPVPQNVAPGLQSAVTAFQGREANITSALDALNQVPGATAPTAPAAGATLGGALAGAGTTPTPGASILPTDYGSLAEWQSANPNASANATATATSHFGTTAPTTPTTPTTPTAPIDTGAGTAGDVLTPQAAPGAETRTPHTGFTVDDLIQDASGNWVPDPARYEQGDDGQWYPVEAPSAPEDIPTDLSPIIMGIAGQQFDPADYEKEFEAGVYDPTMSRFERETRPAIRETFAGGNLFGSGRERSEMNARMQLEEALAGEQARYVAGARGTHEQRQQRAIDQAMQLASLPTEIANAQASTDSIRASISNMFADQGLQEALVDANITNLQLSALTMLWELYAPEQQQAQNELEAEFLNMLNSGPGGLNLMDLLNLLQSKLASTDVAFTK